MKKADGRSSKNLLAILLASLLGVFAVGAPAKAAPDDGFGTGWARAAEVAARIHDPVIPRRTKRSPTTVPSATGGPTPVQPSSRPSMPPTRTAGPRGPPAGTWFGEGPVHLKSNVELHVAKGATLLFTDDTDAYLPQVFTRFEGPPHRDREPNR